MSDAVAGFGTQLIWNYRRVLELNNISGPSGSMDTIEVTHHESPDAYKEYIPGLLSGGEVSVEGNLLVGDENGQVAFHTDIQSRIARTAWIVPDMAVGAAWTFEALAKGFTPSYAHDDKIGVSGSLEVEGKPTYLSSQSTGITGLTGIEENGPGDALVITPAIAAGTYEYACTVDTTSTWVKLTVTAATHTIYVQGSSATSGVQTGEIALGAAGEDTEVFIMVYQADKSPRLYVLTVTRPAP